MAKISAGAEPRQSGHLVQLGAAAAAAGAGWLRDLQGGYDTAFYLAGALCFVAAALCGKIRKAQVRAPAM